MVLKPQSSVLGDKYVKAVLGWNYGSKTHSTDQCPKNQYNLFKVSLK